MFNQSATNAKGSNTSPRSPAGFGVRAPQRHIACGSEIVEQKEPTPPDGKYPVTQEAVIWPDDL